MKQKINRVFVPYWLWEDFNSGMWRRVEMSHEDAFLKAAIDFMSNTKYYGESMGEVSIAWRNTMINSLTNYNLNRRAFLGHCACQYKINCPEYISRLAWKELTEQQRVDSNAIAEIHINKWINNYENRDKKVYSNLGRQMLLRWDS